jgi:hypothetical protein
MTRTVAGLFDSHRTADLVVEHLVQEYGVSRERVRVFALDAAGGVEARSSQDSDQRASLHNLGLPEENLRAYAEGLRRGGILVAARVDESRVGRKGGAAFQTCSMKARASRLQAGSPHIGPAAPPPACPGRSRAHMNRAFSRWRD